MVTHSHLRRKFCCKCLLERLLTLFPVGDNTCKKCRTAERRIVRLRKRAISTLRRKETIAKREAELLKNRLRPEAKEFNRFICSFGKEWNDHYYGSL